MKTKKTFWSTYSITQERKYLGSIKCNNADRVAIYSTEDFINIT